MPDLDELVARLQAGHDPAAVDALAPALGEVLFRFLLTRGLSTADADDLSVSLVTDVILKIDRFDARGPGSFRRWLLQVARNALIDRLRRKRPGPLPPSFDVPEEDDWAEPTDEIEAVRRAVAELGEPDRAIVTARYYEGLDHQAIGERVGLSTEATRVRFYRAKAKLEKALAHLPSAQSFAQGRPSGGEGGGDE